MSEAYRCDQCGQFHDGAPEASIKVDQHVTVELCKQCAPAVVDPLIKVQVTNHAAD